MKISMHNMVADQCVPLLVALSKLLDKGVAYAETKKFDPKVLVNSRLAPDMHPLSRQVQIACDMVTNGAARLAGQEAPKFDDNEQTVDELKARIAKTIDYAKSLPASSIEGSEARPIAVPRRNAEPLRFDGESYLEHFALPNFFFHVTTAYAILRHNGVDLGKTDYIGPHPVPPPAGEGV
jgi:hypothetical protein